MPYQKGEWKNAASRRYHGVEMLKCEWWSLHKTDAAVKNASEKTFPTKSSEWRATDAKNFWWRTFWTHRKIKTFEQLRQFVPHFPSLMPNTTIRGINNGASTKESTEREFNRVQRQKNILLGFHLVIGTLINLSFLFYQNTALVCTKIRRFVQNTLKMCFNSFVLSALNAGPQGERNWDPNVVTETIKLLSDS